MRRPSGCQKALRCGHISERTVPAVAAGTLNIELMTEFRFNNMKVVVTMLEKNLYASVRSPFHGRSALDSRDSEVGQAIVEKKLDNLRVSPAVVQLEGSQDEDDEVERHGVDEHGRQNVCLC